jgi:hypothetical protein
MEARKNPTLKKEKTDARGFEPPIPSLGGSCHIRARLRVQEQPGSPCSQAHAPGKRGYINGQRWAEADGLQAAHPIRSKQVNTLDTILGVFYAPS